MFHLNEAQVKGIVGSEPRRDCSQSQRIWGFAFQIGNWDLLAACNSCFENLKLNEGEMKATSEAVVPEAILNDIQKFNNAITNEADSLLHCRLISLLHFETKKQPVRKIRATLSMVQE